MSHEGVELARKMIDAFVSRDIEALVRLTHPEVEVNALVSVFEGTYKGHDGVRRWIGDLTALAPDYWVVVDDLRPVGDDGFVVLGRQGGTSVAEGVPFEGNLAIVGRLREGLLDHTRAFPTHEEALEAAGVAG